MTLHTVVLQDPTILSLNHDRFLKLLRGESLRVVKTVFSLGDIFGNERVRKVAIDTASHRVVA